MGFWYSRRETGPTGARLHIQILLEMQTKAYQLLPQQHIKLATVMCAALQPLSGALLLV